METMLPPIVENLWLGMHSDESAKTPPGVVQFSQNFFLSDGKWSPRDGFVRLTTGDDPAGVGACRGTVQYQELDGTIHTLAFVNADMYEWLWDTSTWSVVDLATKGITVAPSATLAFANSRGRLIVTDGINQPWMWAATTDTYTVLTSAPIANQVAIYYDRVFFFDATAANIKFEWSTPADPVNGYDGVGNSWEFVQTDSGPVRGMGALNNTLIILKEDSGSFLRGVVESTFETDAVREGLSESEGTISGHSVVILDGNVFFLSQNGPRVALAGQRLMRINEDENGQDRLTDIWATIDKTAWNTSFGFADTNLRMIWWFVPVIGGSGKLQTAIVYKIDEDAWSIYQFHADIDVRAGCQVESTTGAEAVMLGCVNGNVILQTVGEAQDDSKTITRILRSGLHGAKDAMILKRLAEVRLHMLLPADITFQLRPYTDGVVGSSANSLDVFSAGPHRYRKAFNVCGYVVGWEFYQAADELGPEIHSALTFMTATGSYSTV